MKNTTNMPRKATEYDDAIPMLPPEPDINFQIATGESISLTVWQDRESKAKLIKCDICGKFLPLSGTKLSTVALRNHRGKKTCNQLVNKNAELDQPGNQKFQNLSESTTPFTFINIFPDVGPSTTSTFSGKF